MRTALILAITLALPVGAQAQTCASMVAQCRAECPAAMKIGAPAGCTCTERFAICKKTKAWPSWRPGGGSLPVKG
jgi:hypothetical protein